MLPLVLVIAGCVCFAIATVRSIPETPIRMEALGLFLWSLSTFVERL